MRLISAGAFRAVMTVPTCATLLAVGMTTGCATPTAGPAAAKPTLTPNIVSTGGDGPSVPTGDAAGAAAYYRERASALAREAPDEITRTDFTRFRRGRLYAGGGAGAKAEQTLQEDLTAAFDRNDLSAVVDVTSTVLATDQADIRAHMLRAVALRKMQRLAEADFHRSVAVGLINSIMRTGDGRGVKSAWTVFRVKEEYEVIKVLGCIVESQALSSDGDRRLDILEARRVREGGTIRVYFDVTELMAEEEKRFR